MAIAGIQPISQLAQGLSNLAVVSPILSPKYGPIDIQGNSLGPGLIFNLEGENAVHLQSEITSHFIQSNLSVQDHIALKPEIITVHGFIGEVTNLFPDFVPPQSQVQAVLASISAFAPGFSKSAMNTINSASQAYSSVKNAVNGAVTAWNSITGGQSETIINGGGIFAPGASQTKQQLMFAQFYGYWRTKTLFTVQTPWATFLPCPILEVHAVQDEKTNSMTDFFVTFMLIRFVRTQTGETLIPTGRAVDQYAPTTQNGAASLKSSPSLSAQITDFGLGD